MTWPSTSARRTPSDLTATSFDVMPPLATTKAGVARSTTRAATAQRASFTLAPITRPPDPSSCCTRRDVKTQADRPAPSAAAAAADARATAPRRRRGPSPTSTSTASSQPHRRRSSASCAEVFCVYDPTTTAAAAARGRERLAPEERLGRHARERGHGAPRGPHDDAAPRVQGAPLRRHGRLESARDDQHVPVLEAVDADRAHRLVQQRGLERVLDGADPAADRVQRQVPRVRVVRAPARLLRDPLGEARPPVRRRGPARTRSRRASPAGRRRRAARTWTPSAVTRPPPKNCGATRTRPAPARAVRERVDLGREVAAQRRVDRETTSRGRPCAAPARSRGCAPRPPPRRGRRVRQQVATLVRPQLPAQVGPVTGRPRRAPSACPWGRRRRPAGWAPPAPPAPRGAPPRRDASEKGGAARASSLAVVGRARKLGTAAQSARGAARGGRGHRLRDDAHRREVQPAAGRGVPDEREVLGEVPQRRRRGLEGQPRGVRPEAPRPAPREHVDAAQAPSSSGSRAPGRSPAPPRARPLGGACAFAATSAWFTSLAPAPAPGPAAQNARRWRRGQAPRAGRRPRRPQNTARLPAPPGPPDGRGGRRAGAAATVRLRAQPTLEVPRFGTCVEIKILRRVRAGHRASSTPPTRHRRGWDVGLATRPSRRPRHAEK